MKQKQNVKEKLKAEVDKFRAKIEGNLNKRPLYRKILMRSGPLREKLVANLDRGKEFTSNAKNEIKDFRKRFKTEPKRAIEDTFKKAQSIVTSPWNGRKKAKPRPEVVKVSYSQSTKTEKRGSASAE